MRPSTISARGACAERALTRRLFPEATIWSVAVDHTVIRVDVGREHLKVTKYAKINYKIRLSLVKRRGTYFLHTIPLGLPHKIISFRPRQFRH